ncbi:biogenesis of lysosome-related organelles complex 1 subunit 4-like isoform X2 [Sinocyclocheilus anshuiensis]|uniref:biogenesis of lysosome-related organelles complex 1 subunit 4-like isoform X2 n=1 Tax=Sinocyclocheilus anshuiensis TaxID=1608454 RepID=UPI0007B82E2D|nr:PREDICTED: biogenesis of lysosome-related organelles complex 1 subunit 4-like isoform X2 [Sinocyclocheilus anshuiensis]
MEHRFDRAAAVLSPLEESSAEVSRDSGIVSQSTSSLSMVSEALSSGTVSQSPSFGAAVAQSPSSAAGETQPEQTQDDELLRHTAITYSSYIRANAEEEVLCLEKSLEEMLTRVDEFVGMLDMAFVKIVGANVSAMEEQVTQVEGEVGTLPGTFKKFFRTMAVPGFLNKPASPRRQSQKHQELPSVFRTEDYFEPQSEQ